MFPKLADVAAVAETSAGPRRPARNRSRIFLLTCTYRTNHRWLSDESVDGIQQLIVSQRLRSFKCKWNRMARRHVPPLFSSPTGGFPEICHLVVRLPPQEIKDPGWYSVQYMDGRIRCGACGSCRKGAGDAEKLREDELEEIRQLGSDREGARTARTLHHPNLRKLSEQNI